MLVALKIEISGARDGVAWPAKGEPFELPDAEAEQMIANGQAVAVDAKPKPEKAVKADRSEKR